MQKLNYILNDLLKTNSRYKELELIVAIKDCWATVVGLRLSQQCWPSKLLDPQTLLVCSENASLLYQLKFLEKQMLINLNEFLETKLVEQKRKGSLQKITKIVLKHNTRKNDSDSSR